VASFIVLVPGRVLAAEGRLSTLASNAANMPDRTDANASVSRTRSPARRRRALVVSAALALTLHVLFLGGVGGLASGAPESANAPIAVRTIPAEPAAEEADLAETAAALVASPPAVVPQPEPQRRPREPIPATSLKLVSIAEASASSVEPLALLDTFSQSAAQAEQPSLVASMDMPPQGAPEPIPGVSGVVASATSRPDSPAREASAAAADASAPAPRGSPPPLLAAGDQAPPVYKTQLPPSVTLHYEVRRGFLSGEGEIRWQSSGGTYRLALDVRIAGLTLLLQSSEGGIDASGIVPVRFLDKRARRAAQAANFRRELGKVTFSGTGVEWPLLDGSQDRLSWMIQLAGIAAAEPQLLVDGGRITMAVFGARGDVAVWSLRYAGHEEVATPGARVRAIKLVREPSSAHDTGAEVWLDPGRSYLPVRATLLDSAGSPDYDLLLQRVEPAR
jgi:hypothetical protein